MIKLFNKPKAYVTLHYPPQAELSDPVLVAAKLLDYISAKDDAMIRAASWGVPAPAVSSVDGNLEQHELPLTSSIDGSYTHTHQYPIAPLSILSACSAYNPGTFRAGGYGGNKSSSTLPSIYSGMMSASTLPGKRPPPIQTIFKNKKSLGNQLLASPLKARKKKGPGAAGTSQTALIRTFSDRGMVSKLINSKRGSTRKVVDINDLMTMMPGTVAERFLNSFEKLAPLMELDSLIVAINSVGKELFNPLHFTLWCYDEVTDSMFTRYVLNGEEVRVPARRGVMSRAFFKRKIINMSSKKLRKSQYYDHLVDVADKQGGVKLSSVAPKVLYYPMVHANGTAVGVIRLNGYGFPYWSTDKDKKTKVEETESTKLPRSVVDFMDYFAYRCVVSFENTEALPFSGVAFRLIKRLLCIGDVHLAVESIIKVACAVLSAERASVFLVDHGTKTLWSKVGTGIDDSIRIPLNDKSIIGLTYFSKTVLNVSNAYEHPRFNSNMDKKTGFKTRNILSCPIRDDHGMIVGVLQGECSAACMLAFIIFEYEPSLSPDYE